MGYPAVFVALLVGPLLAMAVVSVVARRRVAEGVLPAERELVALGAVTSIIQGVGLLILVVAAGVLGITSDSYGPVALLGWAALVIALAVAGFFLPTVVTVLSAVAVIPMAALVLLNIIDLFAPSFDGATLSQPTLSMAPVAMVALVLGALGLRRPFAAAVLLLTFATPLAAVALILLVTEATPPRWLVLLAASVPSVVAATVLLRGNNAVRSMRTPEVSQRARRRGLVSGSLVAVALVAVGVVAFAWTRTSEPAPPVALPSLADHPDPSLHGTLAYLADTPDGVCVVLVAAAGAPSRTLDCPPSSFSDGWLTWLPDGRLELRHRLSQRAPDSSYRDNVRIYDLSTGATEDFRGVIEDPDWFSIDRWPTESRGRKVVVRKRDGHILVTVDEAGDEQVLLDVPDGGDTSDYDVAWSPDGSYVLVRDLFSRILIITPEDGRVRVFADDSDSFTGWVVTERDLLR